MEKQIKDLTEAETNAICGKHILCKGCPLQLKIKGAFAICLSEIIPIKDKLDKMMEKEIEVEKND